LAVNARPRQRRLFVLPALLALSFGCDLAGLGLIEAVGPADGATLAGAEATLDVRACGALARGADVRFFGRRRLPRGDDFTLVALPDTQFYSERLPESFAAQTRWVVDHRASMNIPAVIHLGDIVDDAQVERQWQNADAAIRILDGAPQLAYGLAVGNHDQDMRADPQRTMYFNRYFPFTRYEGVADWYGGHFGADNDNHYILFSAGGLDFIAIFFEFSPQRQDEALAWADGLLKQHSDRRAILVTHFMIAGGALLSRFSPQGRAIFDALAVNENVFMLLGGHFCEVGRRVDFVDGRPIYTMLADFQCRPNAGDGWVRLLEFSPRADQIRVRTYSPTRDEFLGDIRNEFTLAYEMDPSGPFVEVGRAALDDSGAAAVTWSGLASGAEYEWRAEVDTPLGAAPTALRTFKVANE